MYAQLFEEAGNGAYAIVPGGVNSRRRPSGSGIRFPTFFHFSIHKRRGPTRHLRKRRCNRLPPGSDQKLVSRQRRRMPMGNLRERVPPYGVAEPTLQPTQATDGEPAERRNSIATSAVCLRKVRSIWNNIPRPTIVHDDVHEEDEIKTLPTGLTSSHYPAALDEIDRYCLLCEHEWPSLKDLALIHISEPTTPY